MYIYLYNTFGPCVNPCEGIVVEERRQSAGPVNRAEQVTERRNFLITAGRIRIRADPLERLAAYVAGAARPFPCLVVLLLVVDEVAARTVGTVARDPILLAQLGLVFILLASLPHFLISMCKLTVKAIETASLLFEVSTDFSLEARIGILRIVRRLSQIITGVWTE